LGLGWRVLYGPHSGNAPPVRGEVVSLQRKQTRKASLAESLMNVAIGYGIALASQIVVFPWFGINIPLSSNIAIGLIFTVLSISHTALFIAAARFRDDASLRPDAVHGGFRWLKNTISKVTGTKIIGPFFAANVNLGGSGAY
jgi:hypothetical protein